MPILNSLQKRISWKPKRTEKAARDESNVPNVRPGLIHIVEEGTGPNVDIVYVHGLTGGRNASQTQDTFSTTELSHRNPNARILSWSYDTRAYSSGYRVEDALESHTNCLLEELATVRSEAEIGRRPIVFIAQSLGSMLVKKALLKSCEAGIEEPEPKTVSAGIKQSTLGAVFLGPATFEKSSQPTDLGNVAEKLSRLQNEEFRGLCKDVFVQNVNCEPPTPAPVTTRARPWRSNIKFRIRRTRTSSSSETDTSSHQSIEFPPSVLETVSSLCTTTSIETRHSSMLRDDEKAQSPASETFQDNFNIGIVPNSAPPQEGNFIGREEKLSELFDKLSPDGEESTGRVVVLHGVAGCGKTRLALECCRKNEDDFSTIFWINASSIQSIQSSYATFAKALTDHYATQLPNHFDSRGPVYRHLGLSDPLNYETREDGFEQIAATHLIDAINMWFSQVHNMKWLMVFDDIDETDITILTDFFPTPVSGHILIITRLEDYAEQHGYQSVTLGNMSESESISLFLDLVDSSLITGFRKDNSLLLKVVDGCDHSPLSINQAANFMNAMSINLPTYLEMTEITNHKWSLDLWNGYSETQVDEILTTQNPESDDQLKGYGETTITTYADWEHQFQDLEDSDPTALDLLTLCSFFAKDEIPVALLSEVVTCSPEGSNGRRLEHILKDLTQRSLITPPSAIVAQKVGDDIMSWISGRDSPERLFPMLETSSLEFNLNVLHHQNISNESTQCISINPLVHRWAQKRLNPVAQGVMAERAFQALALAIQSSKRPPSDLIGLEKFLPHLHACLQSVDMVDGDPKVNVKWSILADVCRYQGLHQIARKFYKFSLRKIESDPEPSVRIEAARLRMTLGFVYIQQKHLEEAERQYKKAISHIHDARQTTANDDPKLLQIANLELKIYASLASLYKTQNRLEEAEERYYSILPRFEQVWGSDDIRTLLLLEQFASCLVADGNYKEAEALYRRVLVPYVNGFGREYPTAAKIQQKLAKTLQLQGRYERAEGILQQALTTTEKRYGIEHPETIKLFLFMAQLKSRSRKFEEAEKIYEDLLSSQKKPTGISSAALLELKVNLGMTYQAQKKYALAEVMFRDALNDLRNVKEKEKSPSKEREVMLKLKALFEESKGIGRNKLEELLDEFVERFPNDEISQARTVQKRRRVL